MRILILGNSYSAKRFHDFFKKDSENIVFSTALNLDNYVDFNNPKEIVEFLEANAINLVLIIDEQYINLGLQETISAMNITAFSPSSEAVAIATSKASAKRFMYKNKIKTPKFQIFEKPQMALDYAKNLKAPIAIKPDSHNYRECPVFCETYSSAQKAINGFFESGNKKIVIEDYVEGKSFSVWALSDGYSARILGVSAKYQNEIAQFEPSFIVDELKEKITNEALFPTIEALSKQDDEYIGIIGLDFILGYNNELYLIGYNSFFDDLNVDFFLEAYDINWAQVFESTIAGDVFLKFNFEKENRHMLTFYNNGNIKLISANTKTNLDRMLKELNFNLKEYEEAKKIWKY